MRRQKLFSIAPETPFLARLVSATLDGTLLSDWPHRGPFWLSDVTIIVPTLRARRALAEAFATQLGGVAFLPDIRTFGGQSEDEEPFLPPFDAPPLPAPMSPITRRLFLAQLVEKWVQINDTAFAQKGSGGFASPPSPAEILALADSLGRLIDDLNTEQVPAAALRDLLLPELTSLDLAQKWQDTLKFLDIALTAWPAKLDQRHQIDASAHRNHRLERQATALTTLFGARPVIAAGSTGSIPATAALLNAVSGLERGVLVLPGLDTMLTPDAHAALCDAKNALHGHPQYGLAQLLRRLRSRPDAVTELSVSAAPRTLLVRHALAPAPATASWVADRATLGAKKMRAATAGLSILAARTQEEQARAIALAARAALAQEKSVGIVTPDRDLARRLRAELARYQITIHDSAGTPLFQSRMGRLARQALAVASSNFAPIDLVALLRNRHVVLGRDRAQIAQATDMIEMALLRGQHPAAGLAGLRRALVSNVEGTSQHVVRRLDQTDATDLSQFLMTFETAFAPLAALMEKPAFFPGQLAEALGVVLETLRRPEADGPPAVEGEEEFARWADELKAEATGPRLAARGLDAALAGLMAGVNVAETRPGHPGVAIWGRLEARLQSPDLMILAGLNEGIWPEAADPGPWMSRGMRIAVGLEPPERQHGLAAHDFEIAVGNENTILAYAKRQGTSPATPSRLLQRLEAFVGHEIAAQMRARANIWLDGARAIDAAGPSKPALRPTPKPAAALRPRRLSFTEIETLFRSPYDLYAKHVLGLRKLDALGEEPGARERGNIIHTIFGRFIAQGGDPLAASAQGELEALADEEFALLEAVPERRDIWLRRFGTLARDYLGFERKRTGVLARHAETRGLWAFDIAGQPFTLHGRADRVDQMGDGSLQLFDFKTGTVPTSTEMRQMLAPQLPLEAALAAAVGFEGVPAAPPGLLAYLKIGSGPSPFEQKPFALGEHVDAAALADAMLRRTQTQIEVLLLGDTHPMMPAIFPKSGQRFRGDYDHLSRLEEWTMIEGEDAP